MPGLTLQTTAWLEGLIVFKFADDFWEYSQAVVCFGRRVFDFTDEAFDVKDGASLDAVWGFVWSKDFLVKLSMEQ